MSTYPPQSQSQRSGIQPESAPSTSSLLKQFQEHTHNHKAIESYRQPFGLPIQPEVHPEEETPPVMEEPILEPPQPIQPSSMEPTMNVPLEQPLEQSSYRVQPFDLRPMEHAGLFKRFLAGVIDLAVLWTISYGIGLLFGFLIGPSIWGSIIATFVGVGYICGFQSSSWQATFGMKLLKIRLTDYQGERVSFLRAVGRYLSTTVSVIPLFVGYIMIGFTMNKQALHDLLTKTYVLEEVK